MGPPHIQREGSRGPGQLRMAGPFLQAAASQSQETQSQGSLLLPRAARQPGSAAAFHWSWSQLSSWGCSPWRALLGCPPGPAKLRMVAHSCSVMLHTLPVSQREDLPARKRLSKVGPLGSAELCQLALLDLTR